MENQQLTAQTAKGLSPGIAVKTGTVGANWHQIDTKLSTTLGLMGGLTRGGSQLLQVDLAQSRAAAETLSKSLAETTNLGIAEPSIAEAIIEEIGLHL